MDNVVDRNSPDRDEKCEITIIDDDSNITDVEVTSSPASGDTYGIGETIEISATFSTAVEVNGTPSLGLLAGITLMDTSDQSAFILPCRNVPIRGSWQSTIVKATSPSLCTVRDERR